MQQQERGELAPKEMRFNHGPYSQLHLSTGGYSKQSLNQWKSDHQKKEIWDRPSYPMSGFLDVFSAEIPWISLSSSSHFDDSNMGYYVMAPQIGLTWVN